MILRKPGPPEFEIPELTPSEVKARLDLEQPLRLVDVREPAERRIADLAEYDPIRMPMAEVLSRLEELGSEQPLIIYCRSGSRSGWVVRQLRSRGFENAYNLKGGLLAWRDEVDPSMTPY